MFNRTNGLELICRDNQSCLKGYKYWFEGHNQSVASVWSAPKHFPKREIEASILKIKENMEKEFKTFKKMKNLKIQLIIIRYLK